MRFQIPPGAGPNALAAAPAQPEDAWVMRFIDLVEPDQSYRYRVALKVNNPNYRKPAKDLAIPSLAEKETLQGEWLELPFRVAAPADKRRNSCTPRPRTTGKTG
jgi:hypothetical protein